MSVLAPLRPAAPSRNPRRSTSTCPARAARRASRRSTSCRPTSRRSDRRRGRSTPSRPRRRDLALYPDGSARALREAIGRRFGLDPDRILCGNGSDEILALLAHVFLRPGDEGLYSEHGFLEYPIAIRAAGGTPVTAKETKRTASVDALLAKVGPRTRIVYLANPNNPTGTYLPYRRGQAAACRTAAGLPAGDRRGLCRICDPKRLRAGIELAATCENVVMTRTFSKIHGLAVCGIGWAYGPRHVADAINRVRGALQPERAGDRRRRREHSRTPPMSRRRSRTTRDGCPGWPSAIGGTRNRGDAERGEFPAAEFGRNGVGAPAEADAFLTRARLHPARGRRLWPAGLPAADGRRRGSQPRRRRGAR